MTATTPMTTTAVAELFGVRPWQVRRLYESGRVPEPPARMGAYRLIRPADLPVIQAALVRAGYLEETPEVRA